MLKEQYRLVEIGNDQKLKCSRAGYFALFLYHQRSCFSVILQNSLERKPSAN